MVEGLPYLAAAFFCDRVIEDKEGILSAIRIIDRAQIEIGSNDPAVVEILKQRNVLPTVPLTILLSLRAGPAVGKATVSIVGHRPSGQTRRLHTFDTEMKNPDQLANFILNMNVAVAEDGLYWFDVLWNDEVLTKMPLTIVRTHGPEKSAADAQKKAD